MAPHHTDVPLRDIIDIVLSAKPMAVSFPAANARHEPLRLHASKVTVQGIFRGLLRPAS